MADMGRAAKKTKKRVAALKRYCDQRELIKLEREAR